MRVLDVGAHDGFIGYWLLEQWKARSEQLWIDGLELHPHGVTEARRRGYHRVLQVAAEDAPEHFEVGSYDAVVAYELLEHVPDMGRLLEKLELMLAPGGVIYVSTPDGTFGTGGNPHHLRALRSIDLAELLRRRGELTNMGVGADGICVAAYRPKPRRGDLTIHTGPGWQRWSPLDIDTKGLGGSETAASLLAQALADQGWTVTVYGDVDQGVHRNVVFRHHDTFDPLEPRDVFISSRYPEYFDRPVNARRRMLWLHDTDCGDRLTPARAEHIDDVLVLSGWHQMHVVRTYPWLDVDRMSIIRNGIDLTRFTEPAKVGPRKPRLLYTSSPDRGLDVLLELWPRIRKEVPKATFEHAYAPVYYEMASRDPALAKFHERIVSRSKQKGVKALGHLSQPALATLMRESRVWCAPSWNGNLGAPFYETSCIGAMEAQAAGLHVVASAWGALTETVKVGTLVEAEPPSAEWKDQLVQGIVAGLTGRGTQQHAQANGPLAAAELGWDGVADQITELTDQGALLPAR